MIIGPGYQGSNYEIETIDAYFASAMENLLLFKFCTQFYLYSPEISGIPATIEHIFDGYVTLK
jgi:hypothetical protein